MVNPKLFGQPNREKKWIDKPDWVNISKSYLINNLYPDYIFLKLKIRTIAFLSGQKFWVDISAKKVSSALAYEKLLSITSH